MQEAKAGPNVEVQNSNDGGKSALYRVKIVHSSETGIYSYPEDKLIEGNELVIVPTKYGIDYGTVLGHLHSSESSETAEPEKIIRIANEQDLKKINENAVKQREALRVCRERVAAHGLEMKLVTAHYLLEEPKVIFFFTAEQRVDFRALVKDLVSEFKMRIELRQIGVRDESRILGGLGVCGRFLCCHKITDKLRPVSIKMAKEQNLSLNSMKISGPCGRLLCCLSYEYDFYCEEKCKYPPEGTRITVAREIYKITEVNILSKTLRLAGRDSRFLEVPVDRFSYDKEKGQWDVDLTNL